MPRDSSVYLQDILEVGLGKNYVANPRPSDHERLRGRNLPDIVPRDQANENHVCVRTVLGRGLPATDARGRP